MATKSDKHTVSLQHLRSIVSSLERIVSNFYGPQCTQTLMTSSTGKAVVTSDGYTILQSIHADHPLASVVTKAVNSCHSYTYDGCKTFIIYLSRFLAISEKEILKGNFVPQGKSMSGCSRPNEQQSMLCISKCLRTVINEVMPNVYQQILNYCRDHAVAGDQDIIECLKCVGKTTIMPHYNPKLCEFLTDLLGNLMGDSHDLNSLKMSLQFLLDDFNSLCIRSPNQPYDKSQISPSYIIQRDFALTCESLKQGSPANVLLVDTTIEKASTDQEPKETLRIKTGSQVNESLICKIKRVKSFADKCVKLNVHVVIISSGVPQFALDILRASGISIIHHVLKEDIIILGKISGVMAVSDVEDIDVKDVLTAKSIQTVSVCGRSYVQLQILSKFVIKHLILCAPTVGLCDQLFIVMQKAIKAISVCLKTKDTLQYIDCEKVLHEVSDGHTSVKGLKFSVEEQNNFRYGTAHTKPKQPKNDKFECATRVMNISNSNSAHPGVKTPGCAGVELLMIAGGGGFELILSNILKQLAAHEEDSGVAMVCHMISESLMYILNVLYRNTSESATDKHNYMQVEQHLRQKIGEGLFWGLNRRGVPADMSKSGVLEPVLLKIHTLDCVLVLLEQLLRTDQIVSIRCKVPDNLSVKN